MAMELAIMELAAGMKELAAAMRSAGMLRTVGAPAELGGALQSTEKQVETSVPASAAAAKPGRLMAATTKMDEDGAAGVVQAVSNQIEQRGTVSTDAADQARIDADTKSAEADRTEVHLGDEQAPLDYAKDVRPVLLAAIKKAGKDAVAAMIGKYGVDKADKLKVDQLPAVLAEAQKLAA